ncbi:MAG: M56 family metallopeptidase, partial [Muribaculaceae bacterium]|nr:M56 family metallopeptidase [Muribaculaceae bacterium]
MGSFLAYTLYSGIFLLMLYLVYRLFISGEKQIALNRIILLGCYVVSFTVWPLSRIDWSPTESQFPAHSTIAATGELPLQAVGIVEEDTSVIPQVILWIYLIGALAIVLKTLFSTARLFLYIRKGTFFHKEGYTLVVMPGNETAPFSFGTHIVMSAVDYETVCNSVTNHELAHIRYHHYIDLIVAQTVCVLLWYNPAAWLMRDELKLIHEYQADAAVIDSGADPKAYQMLLIRKTVGNRFHTLANSLNHSKLKNRIAMMQKEKSNGRRRLRLLSFALAVDVALAVVNIPAVASGLKTLESATYKLTETQKYMSDNVLDTSESMQIHKVEEDNSTTEAPAELTVNAYKAERKNKSAEEVKEEEKSLVDPEITAEFPGGIEKLMTYLSHNIRYPFSAFSENRTGKSLV